jgi:hypothetical protein
MAVVRIPGFKSPTPYLQSTITPASAGNSKLRAVNFALHYPYLQTTIAPTFGGMKQKPIPPLPGVAVSGGSYGFPT